MSKGSSRSFIISIVVLMVGMTVGFILLFFAYTGARWKAFVVFLIYFLISYCVIRFSIPYVRYLKEKEEEDQR